MSNSIKVTATGTTGKIELRVLPVDKIVPTEWNPNEMSEDKFNALFDNMAENGVIEPLVVTPIKGTDTFKLVGGHHRLEVAKMLGHKELPCSVKHGIDDDQIKMQNVKLNVIHGKLNPEKFTALYDELSKKHPDRDIAREMGIVSPDELNRLILSTKKQLPEEMQPAFDKASEQIKTVDDLVVVLNELFAKQGQNAEKFHYMILDYEGKESVWVRCQKKDFQLVKELTKQCHLQSVSMDSIVRKLMVGFLSSTPEEKAKFFETMEKIVLPELNNAVPTEEAIAGSSGG